MYHKTYGPYGFKEDIDLRICGRLKVDKNINTDDFIVSAITEETFLLI